MGAPKGKRVFLRQGIGETTIDNVDGNLDVDVAASHARISRVRGTLNVDTGSGGVELADITGDVTLDSGSGGADITNVRGTRLNMDVGSGSLRGRGIDVQELIADIGSGGVRLSSVKAPRMHLETGSGSSDIESDFDVKVQRMERRALRGTIGSGNGRIRVESGSGSVRLIKQ